MLRKRNVQEMNSCKYVEVTEEGLVVERKGRRSHWVDTVVICAGQTPLRTLQEELASEASLNVFLVGGAQEAGELDAKRAIDQGHV